MWEYILGGATVFGLIVTLGAWINSRLTRKILINYFEKSDKRFEELFRRMDEHFKRMDECFGSTSARIKAKSRNVKEPLRFKAP